MKESLKEIFSGAFTREVLGILFLMALLLFLIFFMSARTKAIQDDVMQLEKDIIATQTSPVETK